MNQGPTLSADRTSLTEEEHLCAEFMAYFRAMERGGHQVPPYDLKAAVRDFTISAGEILRIANQYPSAELDALYEQHPLDDDYERPVPVALRKRPYLLFTQVAVLCFERIKGSLTATEYWTHYVFVCPRQPFELGTTLYSWMLRDPASRDAAVTNYRSVLTYHGASVDDSQFESFRRAIRDRVVVLHWDSFATALHQGRESYWNDYIGRLRSDPAWVRLSAHQSHD
jgi:hypothetical protein